LQYLQRSETNVTGAIARNRLPPLEDKEKIEILDEGEVLFWKFRDKNYSFLFTAWNDSQVCTNVSICLPNNVLTKDL